MVAELGGEAVIERTRRLTQAYVDAYGSEARDALDIVDIDGVDRINAAVEPLFGVPSWQIKNFHGSMFMVDFGAASVEIGEPRMRSTHLAGLPTALRRHAAVHGEWTLTIEYCAWELSIGDVVVAETESPDPIMSRALRILTGQALSAVHIDPGSGATDFTFDLGAVLRTRPEPAGFYGGEPVELWTLKLPDNQYIGVRDDGTYSVHDAHVDPETYVWSKL